MSATVGWKDARVKPGFWIGPLGGLVALPDIKGDLSDEGGREVTLRKNPMTGNTTAFVKRGGTREWSCSMPSAYPDEAAVVSSVAGGALGDAEHWWITPEAAWQNLLPERASLWMDGWEVLPNPPTALPVMGRGGNVITEDGVAVGSALLQPVNWFAYQSLAVPTPPDRGPVSIALDVSASAMVRLVFTDGSGRNSQTQHHTVTAPSGSGPLHRVVITGPANAAAGFRIQIRGATVAARPTMVWGDRVGKWSTGRGSDSVILHSLSTSVLNAHRDPDGLRRRGLSFTVTEVRAG